MNQTLNGLPVVNGTAVFIQKGEVLILTGNRLVPGEKEVVGKAKATPVHSILNKVWFNLSGEKSQNTLVANEIAANKYVLKDNQMSELDIPAELAYFFDGTTYRLIYETSLKIPGQNHWYNIYTISGFRI